MDAFYASVEIRDNPALAGKPLIIGALPTERGVVATCSYEARKFGVHSGQNIKEAYRLCPHGIYMHGNFAKYREASAQLHEIWNDYAVALESVALDEAYLDVTYSAGTWDEARRMAAKIKERTRKEVGLTCSVGVAYSKTAAKTASEEKKPDGYFEILTPQDFVDLMIDRKVRSLYTVGEKTAEKLNRIGIYTVRDIQEHSEEIIRRFGKHGQMITELAMGIDDRKVVAYKPEDAKSISREVTFQEDVDEYQVLDDVLVLLALSVEDRARRVGLHGRGVTLKLTYSNMQSITRSRAVIPADRAGIIYRETSRLLEQVAAEQQAGGPLAQTGRTDSSNLISSRVNTIEEVDSIEGSSIEQLQKPGTGQVILGKHRPVRLVGAGIYNLATDEGWQMTLDDYMEESAEEQQQLIDDKLAEIGARYGLDFAGHLEDLRRGDTLYRTIEYMRKHYRGRF